jgi:hypothetical protein
MVLPGRLGWQTVAVPGELDGVRLLWHNDYWDGPVSGLAEYHGKEYWFQAIWDVEADDWEHPRRYGS